MEIPRIPPFEPPRGACADIPGAARASRAARALSVLAAIMLLAIVLLIAGCDEDPAGLAPGERAPQYGEPTTADQLVENFRVAFTARDSALFVATFAPGFTVELDPAYVAAAGLEADHLIEAEIPATVSNLFGERLVIDDGELRPAVTEIAINRLVPLDETWQTMPAARRRQDFPVVYQRRYDLTLQVSFTDLDDAVIEGEVLFRAVTTIETKQDGELWSLIGLADGTFPTGGAANDPSLGRLWRNYLGNRAPQAVVTPSSAQIAIGESIVLSGAGSSDPDGNIAAVPYRWRFRPDGPWTDWSADPEITTSFADAGPYEVTLEVRDRWGRHQADFASIVVE